MPKPKPLDPSPTPKDHSTWGFYCDTCEKFFDLVLDGTVTTHEGNSCTRFHKACGQPCRYIGYKRESDESDVQTKIEFRDEVEYKGQKHPILMVQSGLFLFEDPSKLPVPPQPEAPEWLTKDWVSYNIQYNVSRPGQIKLHGIKSPVHTVKAHGKQALELTRRPNKDGR